MLRDGDRLKPLGRLRERPLRLFPYVNDPQIAFWRLRDGTAPRCPVLLMVSRDCSKTLLHVLRPVILII